GDNSAFQIINGQLLANATFDYEARSQYSVLVRATAAGDSIVEQWFTIQIEDTNNAPVVGVSLKPWGLGANAGTVVAELVAFDHDFNDSHFFLFETGVGAADNGLFSIVGNQLVAASGFDFNGERAYSIRVQVTDSEGLSSVKDLSFTAGPSAEVEPDLSLDFASDSIPGFLSVGELIDSNGRFAIYQEWTNEGVIWHRVSGVEGESVSATGTGYVRPFGNALFVGDDLYFQSSVDTSSGYSDYIGQLWVWKASAATPELLATFENNFDFLGVASAGARLIFARIFNPPSSEDIGLELWSSDGTTFGTTKLASWAGGVPGNFQLVSAGEFAYFTGVENPEIWKTDGSVAGTFAVPGFSEVPWSLKGADDGTVLFSGYSSLWVSDGTDSGTNPLPGTAIGNGRQVVGINGDKVYFFARENGSSLKQLYARDRANSTTSFLGSFDGDAWIDDVISLGESLVFRAGTQVWITSGTQESTSQLFSRVTSNSPEDVLVSAGNKFYFTARSVTNGSNRELWVSDGTVAGTSEVISQLGSVRPQYDLAVIDDRLIFTGSASNTGLAVFSISLVDVNESPTDIALSSSSLAENSGVNAVLGSLSTSDPNAGDTFTYTLVSGDGSADNGAFNIDGDNLRANSEFDFEVASSYNIRVRSTDNGNLSFEKTFLITVTDVNEAPTITITNVASPLAENSNTANSIHVANISITDEDGGTNTLSLSDADAASFEIVGGNQLHLRSGVVLDFETKSTYVVTVQSDDTTIDGSPDATAIYTLIIGNVNERPTNVTLTPSSIPENAVANTVVGTLATIDPDAGDTFTYTLVSGVGSVDNAAFTILGTQLTANSSFDFEQKSSYLIRVESKDAGNLTFEKELTISVSNVNERPTDIALSVQSIAENRPVGTTVGTFSTTDPDTGDAFFYLLVLGEGSSGNSQFTIVGNQLRAAASFNFEVASSYNIRVRSTDNGNLGFEKTFLVTVTDVNESPTITITNVASPLAENSSTTNSILVANISLTDPDGGINTLSLSGADAASFEIIGGDQLHLRSGGVLDFETKSSYFVTVQSDDTTVPGTPDVTATYTLSISNVNEHPTGVQLSNRSVLENRPSGTLVGLLSAIDPDNSDTATFQLLPGQLDNADFQIHGNQLQSARTFDAEEKWSYEIRIRVMDAGGLSVDRDLLIDISGENEWPPVFTSPTSYSHPENITDVGLLNAPDPDKPVSNVVYTIVGGADQARFSLVGPLLRMVPSPNFEVPSSAAGTNTFEVIVRASDGLFNVDQTLTVNIANANDLPTLPVIDGNTIPENEPIGTVIGVFGSSDDDGDTVSYFLVSGYGSTDNSSFQIVGNQLRSTQSFNYEFLAHREMSIRVAATDGRGGIQQRTFTITTLDINEAPSGVEGNVSTDMNTATAITLQGFDPENAGLTFSLVQSPRFGSLSGAIPDLLYTPNPNFVGQDELFFTVSDGTLLSTETRVLISVIGPKPTISFSTDNVTVNEGVGIYSLTLNSSIALPYDLWVPFSVAATSTASELEDYSSILPFLGIRIPAGQTTGTTSIQILDDLMFEPGANESLVVDLVANPFSTIGTLSRFTLSIADNDVAPLVRFSSPGVSVLEGASQAVTVRLTGRSTQTVTVPFSIDSSSTAALGTDYNTLVPSSSLVFMPGEIAKTISIPLINDQNVELTETLRINLGTPINATLSTVNRSFSLTIIDDDKPTVSMSRLTRGVQETTGQVTVTAALSQATSNEIVVPYILGGTATSGVSGNVDVLRSNTPLQFVFAPGQVTVIATFIIQDDTIVEPTETFEVRLAQPATNANYTLGNIASTVFSIQDNDRYTVSFSTPIISVWEDAGTVSVTATLSSPAIEALSVPITVSSNVSSRNKATFGRDFYYTNNRFHFGPGANTSTLSFSLIDDSVNEPTESARIALSPASPSYRLGSTNALELQILDDDPLVSLVSGGSQVYESTEITTTITHTVKLTAPTNKAVTVPFQVDGTARQGIDYSVDPSNGSITIPEGSTSASIVLSKFNNNNTTDGNRSVSVSIGDASELRGSPTTVSTEIVDDDQSIVSFKDDLLSVKESRVRASGRVIRFVNRSANVEIAMSSPAVRDVWLTVEFVGSATYGVDYRVKGLSDGKIKIPAGRTSARVGFEFINDRDVEGWEVIRFRIIEVTSPAKLAAPTIESLIFIEDDDLPPAPPLPPARTTSQVPIVTGTLALELPELGQQPMVSAGRSSSTRTIPPSHLQAMVAGSLNIGAINQGSISNGLVFFDANFNGIADEDEPFAMTTADGAFAIPVDESFDTNANGQIEPSEGRWVAIDGTDISINELWRTQLAAPVGMFSITPITTLIESVVRNRSLSVSEASTLTLDALGITNFDLWSRNALFDILAYDQQASEAYKVQVQLYATVIQMAELLAARTSLTVNHVANEIYDTLSDLISPDGVLDFGSSIHVEALLRSVVTKLGIEMEQDVLTGVSEVMAESQRFVGGIMLSDHETGNSFLLQVNKAKKVLQGRLPAAMAEVGAGTRSISSLVSSFTGAALQAEISSQSVSVTLAPVVGINSLSIHEGNAGSSILRFSVEIVGEHDYPVSVGFTTVPGTATAEVDYLSHSGTITWPAGDSSTKFIDVTILGDSIHEFDETFKVLLLNAEGVAVRFAEGTAFIVNDDLKVVQPVASDTVNQWRIARSTELDFAVIQNETIHLSGLYTDPVRVNVPGADHIPDHYRVDFSSNSYLSDVYSLAGGSGVQTDTFQAIAGFFDTIEHTLVDSGNSKTRFIPSASTSGVASPEATVVELESVESVSLSPTELSTLIVHVPSSITELTVMDADPNSLGRNKILSPTNAFAPIEFTNPGSLVIRRASAATMVTLGTLDPLFPASNISVHTILSLGNTVSSLLEGTRSQRVKVADVVLDPYAVGPHLLRLDGEHKALFELDGQSLFLKANSTLDFETLPTVSVKIILDDPNLVGSADAEVLYSLEVGDGDLIVDDSNGIDNRTSIRLVDDGGDLYLEVRDETDQFAAAPAGWTLTPDNKAIRTLASAFTGTITVNAAGGDDTLTVDFRGGTDLPNIIFDGGIGGFDTLEVVGGNFNTITKTFTNASDGNVVFSDGPAVTYIGLEPVLLNVGSVADIVFHLPATVSAATLADDGTALKLSGADFEDTTFPNPTGSLAINRGNAADTLIIGSTVSNLTSTLTVGTNANPFHSITVSGALALNSGNNKDLGLYATRIAVSAAVSARNITLDADTGSQVAGDFIGVNITANVTGTGQVQIGGRGGDGLSGRQHGVQVAGGAALSGLTTEVSGLAGASTAAFNTGVNVTDPNSRITSGGGNVQVKGEPSSRGWGVAVVLGGQVTSGGSGTVTVEGTGNTVGNVSFAVYLFEGQITSGGNGAVTVTGIGGSGTQNNQGVQINGNSSRITSGGVGTVTVEGTGGSSSHGGNFGVWTIGGQITSGGGSVTVKANSHGNNTTAAALRLENSGGISSGGNAPVLITTDSVTIIAGGFINSGTGTTTIRPRTAGTLINLGGADVLSGSPLTLGLTDAELDQITAGTLQIGDGNSGTITVSAALTHNNSLSLTTGAGITLNRAITMASDRNFSATTASTTLPINLATTNADIATSGTGSVSLTATRNIVLASGSSVTTVNGNLSLSVNQQPTATSGNFIGIDVNAALIQATGTGSVSVLGRGGNDAAGRQFGVLVRNGADIIGGTTGTVTVNGSGGVSSGSDNYGVYVVDNGSTITSGGGAVSVTGTGGDAGSGVQNFGIVLFSGGQITAGSGGTVTVIGTGGASS
ncbi:MAG: Calx-beta domain-containing protein, partial [Pirellula sp.]